MQGWSTWQLDTRHLGRLIVAYESVTSTNDVAPTHPLGTVVLSNEQTAGRGRYGRAWDAPPGTAIQLSLTIDPPARMSRPVILTAWATVAVAETVQQFTNLSPWIKWPNDVLLQGRKVAGILIENKSRMIVGIGLNVNQSAAQFAAAGLLEAGSLASISRQTYDRDAVARQLILNLDAEFDALIGNAKALESRWVNYVGLQDQPVVMETVDGTLTRGRLVVLNFNQVSLELENENKQSMFMPLQIERRPTISVVPESVRHLSFDL